MKRILLSVLVLVFTYQLKAQTLYDINTVQDIKIVFNQSNWDYLLDTAIAGKESYLMAKTVTINGVVFDSVGVRYKGNSTYKANQTKNPFHIELDTWKDQNYEGYTDLKLSNVAFDPSFVREPLSYSILRQYMDAPESNYANVYVNGTLIGVYVNSESISKKFVKTHFYSKDNAFFKCNPVGGAGPGSSAKPNLAYLGNDSTLYYSGYEMNSDHGWKDLVALCDTLKNKPKSLESVMDVDRAIWMLAFNNVLVNLDSYSGSFVQNYYLYKDDYNRFNPVVWDLNMSFGVFNMTGTIQLQNTTAKQNMTHLLHSGDAGWPLIQKILAIPMYKRMYIAHMRTMLAENFANNNYKTTATAYQAIISPYVSADPNKFYSYAQFQSNLTSDVTGGMFNVPGITNLMGGRNTYLSGLADFTAAPPVISNIQPSSTPILYEKVTITATVNNSNSDAVFFGFRYDVEAPFTRVLMFDDGNHNDGAAGDKVYGVSIDVNSLSIQYYIYAENDNAGVFSPVRAEHEFYTLNAEIVTIAKGDLVINELMADNDTTILDPSGKKSDWIELYNNSEFEISLKNAYLSDSYTKPLKWRFPDNVTLAPHDYLIVWASDTTQAGLNASFKLSSTGERVILSYENGFVTDSISFGALKKDESFSRCPNGTGSFEISKPTFNAENCKTTSVTYEINNDVEIFPNPANDRLYFRNSGKYSDLSDILIADIHGGIVKNVMNMSLSDGLDISQLPPGFYLIKFNHAVSSLEPSIKKFIKQ